MLQWLKICATCKNKERNKKAYHNFFYVNQEKNYYFRMHDTHPQTSLFSKVTRTVPPTHRFLTADYLIPLNIYICS